EILERLQRLRHTVLARSVLGIVEEPAACVCQETLGRAELAELAQQVKVLGRVAQRLVAERDGVVGEARVGVAICGLRVVANGVVRLADANVEVADAVVEWKLDVAFALPQLEHALVRLDRLVPVLAQLVPAGVVLELVDLLHASPASEPASAARCCSSRVESSRSVVPGRRRSRSAAASSTSTSGTSPITSVSTIRPPCLASSDSRRRNAASGDAAFTSSTF